MPPISCEAKHVDKSCYWCCCCYYYYYSCLLLFNVIILQDTKPPFSPEESSSERLEDEFAESFSRLQVGDDTFLSPDTESTSSTHSDDSSTTNPRRKLNDFLVACKIEPLEKPWLNWQDSSGATRQRYTKKATEIVTAVLKTISPDSAGNLWHSLISSSAVNKALDLDELPQSENRYIEALAEAYNII